MSGYSGTPLAKKLGLQAGQKVTFFNPPDNYFEKLGDIIAEVDPIANPTPANSGMSGFPHNCNWIHFFSNSRSELADVLPSLKSMLQPDGQLWISWPKKSSGVATDLTEDVIRELALPLQLVDVKVCAIDEIWSGLKLVIRKSARDKS
jgi:hypothetical protein